MTGSEPWRERVDDVLWVEYGMLAHRADAPGSHGVLGPGSAPAMTGLETIDAFEQVGLLDATHAAAWRACFEAPVQPWGDHVPADRLRHALAGMIRATLATPRRDEAWGTTQNVLNDLRAAGLLDDEDLHWWFGLLAPRDQEPVAGTRAPEARFARFLRSVPGPPERHRGLRLLSVDLFDDGVCVHLQLARRGMAADGIVHPLPDEREPARPLMPRGLQIRLEDDLGTEYVMLGGGGGGGAGNSDGPVAMHSIWRCGTPVPAAATRVRVVAEDATFEVGL